MDTLSAAELLAALGHESRLAAFRLLVEAGPAGAHAGTLGESLQMAPATLSFHLAHLQRVGLIRGERESRFIRYRAEYPLMDELLAFLTRNCCEGNTCLPKIAASDTIGKRRGLSDNSQKEETDMEHRIYTVLFLCTGNSARSILAEAILNQTGKGHFRAFSAGSHPAGVINPFALELLQQQHYPTDALRSKSWDEFSRPGAPAPDFVITVCDKAAGEKCPVWPGQPLTAHWGIDDPAAATGDDAHKRRAMVLAFHLLQRRIALFLSLPTEKLDRLSLQHELNKIGGLSRNEP